MRSFLPDMKVPLGEVLGRAAMIFVPVAAALTAAACLLALVPRGVRSLRSPQIPRPGQEAERVMAGS